MISQSEPPAITIEPLGNQHDRAAFSCGVEALDSYLHKQAGQDARKRAAVIFIATNDGTSIVGYYTLSQYAIQLDSVTNDIAKKLPRYPMIPTTLLGRLAVASNFRGQRFGETLLMDALYRSLTSSTMAASAGVVVDAKDDSAVAFYRKYGFIDLLVPRRLFLPMGTIDQLFPAKIETSP